MIAFKPVGGYERLKADVEVYEWIWICPNCKDYQPNFIKNSDLWGEDAGTNDQKCDECGVIVQIKKPV